MPAESASTTCHEAVGFELVDAARQGDRDAFGPLFECHRGMVYATAYGVLRNHADAEEACQDVFLQAMEKIEQLCDPQRFSGWLQTMAYYRAINKERTKKRQASRSTDFRSAPAEQTAPQDIALAREQEVRVRQALGRLRRLDRELLVAFYFDGSSLPEISSLLHTPLGTIKRRLHMARKRLAQELKSDTVATESGFQAMSRFPK